MGSAVSLFRLFFSFQCYPCLLVVRFLVLICFLCDTSCPLWLKVFWFSPRLRVSAVRLFFRSPDYPMSRSPDLPYLHLQLQHLHRTLRPIIRPADNQIASARVVSMFHKIPALVFKFHSYPLPPVAFNSAHRLAVREVRLHPRHHITQLLRHRAK